MKTLKIRAGGNTTLQEAWIAAAQNIDWQLFATLTFARPCASEEPESKQKLESQPNGRRYRKKLRPVTLKRVNAAFAVLIKDLSRFSLGCARGHRESIYWLRAIEHHKQGEAHIHALLASPPDARRRLSPHRPERRWVGLDERYPRIGISKIEKFDPDRLFDALRYVTKTADAGGNIMANLPRAEARLI